MSGRELFNKVAFPLAASRAGGWLYTHVLYRLDLPLLRLTKGRVRVAFTMPHAILTTTGARSGKPRSLPLVCFRDEDRRVLIASNGGSTRHPGWYHNLRKNPSATLEIDGQSGDYTAREAEGDERTRLWAMAAEAYWGYDAYQRRAGERRIPVMVLEPA